MCENELLTSSLSKVIVFYGLRMHLVTRGHFRARDKDGGHMIRHSRNPMLHANLMALSFIEPDL